MRHFEAVGTLGLALLAALGCGVIACSSDSDHGPPVGAPGTPVVTTEGGGAGGGVNLGQGATANSGGDTSAFGGSFDSLGTTGGVGFADPSAGSTGFGTPGTAGSTSQPPFGASGSPSAFGGSGF